MKNKEIITYFPFKTPHKKHTIPKNKTRERNDMCFFSLHASEVKRSDTQSKNTATKKPTSYTKVDEYVTFSHFNARDTERERGGGGQVSRMWMLYIVSVLYYNGHVC